MEFVPVTAAEIIIFHDRLESSAPGLPGMADSSKAEAVIARINALAFYDELPDLWHVAAAHLQAVARGHIFADYNKRTALLTLGVFLRRNGILLNTTGTALEDLTVKAATGELDRPQIAAELQRLAIQPSR